MPSKYRITTDQGVYEVTVDDSPASQKAGFVKSLEDSITSLPALVGGAAALVPGAGQAMAFGSQVGGDYEGGKRSIEQLHAQTKDLLKKGDYLRVAKAIQDHLLGQGLQEPVDKIESQIGNGDYAGAAGTALGFLTPSLIGGGVNKLANSNPEAAIAVAKTLIPWKWKSSAFGKIADLISSRFSGPPPELPKTPSGAVKPSARGFSPPPPTQTGTFANPTPNLVPEAPPQPIPPPAPAGPRQNFSSRPGQGFKNRPATAQTFSPQPPPAPSGKSGLPIWGSVGGTISPEARQSTPYTPGPTPVTGEFQNLPPQWTPGPAQSTAEAGARVPIATPGGYVPNPAGNLPQTPSPSPFSATGSTEVGGRVSTPVQGGTIPPSGGVPIAAPQGPLGALPQPAGAPSTPPAPAASPATPPTSTEGGPVTSYGKSVGAKAEAAALAKNAQFAHHFLANGFTPEQVEQLGETVTPEDIKALHKDVNDKYGKKYGNTSRSPKDFMNDVAGAMRTSSTTTPTPAAKKSSPLPPMPKKPPTMTAAATPKSTTASEPGVYTYNGAAQYRKVGKTWQTTDSEGNWLDASHLKGMLDEDLAQGDLKPLAGK